MLVSYTNRATSYLLPRWCFALGALACLLIFVLWQSSIIDANIALFLGSCTGPFLAIHVLFLGLNTLLSKKRGTILVNPECRLGIPLATMFVCPLIYAVCISFAGNICFGESHASMEVFHVGLTFANALMILLWIELSCSIEQDGCIQPELRNFAIATLLLAATVLSENDNQAVESFAVLVGLLSTFGAFFLALFELVKSKILGKAITLFFRSNPRSE